MNEERSALNILTHSVTIFMLLFSVTSALAQEKIVVGGSGSLNDEMTLLAKTYIAKYPSETIEVRPESMSTEGGIKGVRMGRLQIGLVSRPLIQAERGQLIYFPIARSMAGVGFHNSIPIHNLTEEQICGIFAGKLKNWKELGAHDGKITVLTRKRDDNNTETFREKMPCFRDLVITEDAVALIRGSEVLAALDKRVGTVGIVNLGSTFREFEHIKVAAIDGVKATADNARTEKYRYFNERGLVTLGEPKGLVKRFIDYMSTPEGRKILGSLGAIPVL